ncbi:MAG TPA: hypothetical protein VHX19_06250 [Stellaceae bacterium]|jgi:hypothetical protein|nr:hypothetical protein [Stellaceae bacterium]
MDDKDKSRDEKGEHGHDRGANQGEGDYRSARNYDEHVRRTVESGQVDKKAHEAEKAIEGKEGDDLRRAEEMGKRHSHGEDPQLHKKN